MRCFSGQQPSTGRLDERDHFPWIGDQAAVIREIRRFLGTVRAEEADLERVLATVLFTDIVGSTEKAVELGDRGWRELVARYESAVRALLLDWNETSTRADQNGDEARRGESRQESAPPRVR